MRLQLGSVFSYCSGVLGGSHCYFKESPAGVTTGCQHPLTVICPLAGCESSPAYGQIAHYSEFCSAIFGGDLKQPQQVQLCACFHLTTGRRKSHFFWWN